MDLSNIPARASADWPSRPKRVRDEFFMGVDIGQSSDPTAICILQHRVVPLETWTPKHNQWFQDFEEYFDVRHLERLPLGRPYPEYVETVASMLDRPPIRGNCTLVIDETGVGRPVGDMFDKAGLRPSRVTITAGLEATRHGGDSWHVPKALLITNLEARQHAGTLRVGAKSNDAEALRSELKDFRRILSSAGRPTWNAREGKHDDLILALAIALFAATGGKTETYRTELLI